jgi:hypothetical protein
LEVLGVADEEGEVGFFEEVGRHCGWLVLCLLVVRAWVGCW